MFMTFIVVSNSWWVLTNHFKSMLCHGIISDEEGSTWEWAAVFLRILYQLFILLCSPKWSFPNPILHRLPFYPLDNDWFHMSGRWRDFWNRKLIMAEAPHGFRTQKEHLVKRFPKLSFLTSFSMILPTSLRSNYTGFIGGIKRSFHVAAKGIETHPYEGLQKFIKNTYCKKEAMCWFQLCFGSKFLLKMSLNINRCLTLILLIVWVMSLDLNLRHYLLSLSGAFSQIPHGSHPQFISLGSTLIFTL